MSKSILSEFALGVPWTTFDPFLFCVHHDDAYPKANENMGPAASLAGRQIGSDFASIDGWSMYHGERIPGFPRHPHRGFETVTLARQGYIDHSDSLGAKARFGQGDAQWMTAGSGVVHSEMFPLLNQDAPNPAELFQIWINLPGKDKMVPAHFSMLWSDEIPRLSFTDDNGGVTEVVAVAGAPSEGVVCPTPPPHSWASHAESDVAIWTIKMSAGASWTMPPAKPGTNRSLYYFKGSAMSVDGHKLEAHCGMQVQGDVPLELRCGEGGAELLLLQGKPIGEPVAHYGPFVMNSHEEIQQAIVDFRRTEYGGWPWADPDPVHGRDEKRFAVHADGREDEPSNED